MPNTPIPLLILLISISLIDCSIIQTEQQSQNIFDQDQYNLVETTYEQFLQMFEKTGYQISPERKQAFDDNVKTLRTSTCNPCGVTEFMDKTQSQLKNLLGLTPGIQNPTLQERNRINAPGLQAGTPAELNWTKLGAVSSVKYQDACGSCWTFATAAFLQSQLTRRNKTRNTVDVAEQFFLQCDKQSFGCSGGFMNTALALALKFGVPVQRSYPYNYSKVYTGTICSKPTVSYKLANSSVVSYWSPTVKKSDEEIISYLAQRPIIVAVCATEWFYYTPTPDKRTFSCSAQYSTSGNQLNHGVLLVGYTATEWIVKNSWGKNWGLNGYIYISRVPQKNCGIGYEFVTLNYTLPTGS